MLKIEFSMENDYFSYDPVGTAIETIESIIKLIKRGETEGKVWDINGNSVGNYSLKVSDDMPIR